MDFFKCLLLLTALVFCLFVSAQSYDVNKVVYPKNVSQIIQDYGYPVEEHLTDPTEDGFKLHIQRIPYGMNNKNDPKLGVVFFQHGLIDNSAGVNLNNPTESLSFILADAGYDVWIGNNRGNGISMENVLYKQSQKEYWDFSFDEMASMDFPTQIKYVLAQTGVEKLTYIGHSEGTIQAFAALSRNPSLASMLNLYVALAPVAYVQYTESIVMRLLADFDADEIFILLGLQEFNLPSVLTKILPGYCGLFPRECSFLLEFVCGPTTFLNDSRNDYYLHYEPNPTSVKNMVHWSQSVKKGTFGFFDYGKKGNIENYNQPTPPEYDLTQFPTMDQLPTAIFAGGKDYLGDPKDVQRLLSLLPTAPLVHYEADYAHLDPLLGINANQRIYPIILNLIAQVHANTSEPLHF